MKDEQKTRKQLIDELEKIRLQAIEMKVASDRSTMDIIEGIPDAIAIINPDGTILQVNNEFERQMGWKREELAGKKPLEVGFVSKKEAQRIEKEVLLNLTNKGLVYGFESTVIKKDGTTFPVLINWKLMKDIEGRPKNIIVTATDITGQKQAEEKIIQHRNELEARSRIISKLLQTFDLDERLNLILDEAMALTGVDFGAIFLARGKHMELSAWRGISGDFLARIMSFPIDKCPDWLCKHKIIHERLSEQGEIPDFAKLEGIQSKACLPLYSPKYDNKEFIGTLMLASRNYNILSENDVKILEAMRNQLVLAIDHVQRHREAKERMARLEVLREIDSLIINRLDINHILDVVLENVSEELGAEAVAISLLGDDKNSSVFSMILPNGNIIHKEAFSIADNLMYWFIEQREPVIIYNLAQDPRIQMHRKHICNHKLVSYLGVPMVAQDSTIGILHLLTTKPKVFSEEDIAFFCTLAGQTAIALKSAQLVKNTKESEKKYRDIFENAAEGIFEATLDGKLLLSNPQMARMLGYESADDFISKVTDINRIYFNPSHRAEFMKMLKEKETVSNFETQMYHRNGLAVWISEAAHLIHDERGKPLYYEGICTDITSRKKAELSLRESEEKYRNLVEFANDGICIVQDGKIEYCNPRMAEMWGGTPEEIIGKSFKDYVHPDELQKVLEYYRKRLSGEYVPQGYELKIKRKDGSTAYIDIKGNAINYKGKPADHCIVRDITEQKKAEEEKEKLYAQFLQAQKMEAVGRLSGGIAHDFNNMLTAVLGYSDLLLLKLELDSPMREYIKEIKNAGTRAAGLTSRLLAFSRKQSLQKEVLNLNEIISSIENMLKRIIGENIKMSLELVPGLQMVNADSGQIEQIITNLVVNARDAMPGGGTIKIKTENVLVTDEYCKAYTYARPGHFVCLSVEDTGIGIDNETLGHIFEPFFTTKETGKGTGLGLSASYGIIKQHEGWINVHSELGKGTTFKIYIPTFSFKEEGTVSGEEETKVSLRELQGRGEKILFIEDEEDVRRFVIDLLRENGYTVSESKNVAEALKSFEEEKENFHLIFSDVTLPDGNGLELVDELLKRKPGINVLFTSGYLDDDSKLEYIRKKGLRFLKKPFTAIELLRAIKSSIIND